MQRIRHFLLVILIIIFLGYSHSSFSGTNLSNHSFVTKIVLDVMGVPFLLDANGKVWAFKKPLSMEGPILISGLSDIKDISPYMALDKNGHVFIWRLISTISGPEDDEFFAQYSFPVKVPNMNNVLLISSSGNHFLAYNKNKELIEWYSFLDNKENFKIYFTKYNIISRSRDIKDISSTTTSSAALFSNETIEGWGVSASGQTRQDSVNSSNLFQWNGKLLSISMNKYHIVALSSEGKVIYWGGCDLDGHDPNGRHYSLPPISAVVMNVPAISQIAISTGNDNVLPDAFLKKDGNLMLNFAPGPPDFHDNICGKTMPIGLETVFGLPKPIVSVVEGGGRVVAIDNNNIIWKSNLQGPLHFLKVKFN